MKMVVMLARVGLVSVGLVLAVAGTGCAPASWAARPGLHVIAAFYPYAFVAQRLVGNAGTVVDLTRPGTEPHDIELTPQQVAKISTADVVVYQRGFQPSVDAAVEQNPPAHALDVTTVVPLRTTMAGGTDGTSTQSLPDDPHLWLNPRLLMPIAGRLAEILSRADPTHADQFHANARALDRQLVALDSEIRRGLATCRRRTFVTSHAAFGYFAARYGLTMLPIAGLSPEAEPSPNRLAQLQALIQRDGITTVFSEVLETSKYATSLADDSHARSAVLDPIEGLTVTERDQNYLSLMRGDLRALQKANHCS